uniref:Uncharacterized protein n=1 Tax=viral metagenome TaxID=1070528 RepID=A0A6H1ZN37_9ZZZZ
MNWHPYEKRGWSWSSGWNPGRGGYFAQAWRDLPKRLWVDGRWMYRECLIEGGKTIEEATSKLMQRLDGLGELRKLTED